jgi:antitoxin Phd
MIVYTYSEARQKLATVLDKARKEGEVRIKRKDGQIFIIKPQAQKDSPLNVVGIDLDLTSEEIVAAIQEGRRAY